MTTNELLIASANTYAGFAIGIVKSRNYRTGASQFQVVRMDRASRYVTLAICASEGDARKRANAEWKADMRAAA